MGTPEWAPDICLTRASSSGSTTEAVLESVFGEFRRRASADFRSSREDIQTSWRIGARPELICYSSPFYFCD